MKLSDNGYKEAGREPSSTDTSTCIIGIGIFEKLDFHSVYLATDFDLVPLNCCQFIE